MNFQIGQKITYDTPACFGRVYVIEKIIPPQSGICSTRIIVCRNPEGLFCHFFDYLCKVLH